MKGIQARCGTNVRIFQQPVKDLSWTGVHLKFGIKGMADLTGVVRGGRRLEVEVKTGNAELEPDQISWRDMMVDMGALWLLAHSVTEEDEDAVIDAVARAINGAVG